MSNWEVPNYFGGTARWDGKSEQCEQRREYSSAQPANANFTDLSWKHSALPVAVIPTRIPSR